MIKQLAVQTYKAIEKHAHVSKVSSSSQNIIGMYFSIDVQDLIARVTLSVGNASGHDISAHICTNTRKCCDIEFRDQGSDSITTKQPQNCDDFLVDSSVNELNVSAYLVDYCVQNLTNG